MRYLSFSVKNYKGIRELDFDMSGRIESKVFTLVGLNESGKTTLLEAMTYWYESFKRQDDVMHELNIEDPRALIPRAKQFNFNELIKISAKIEISPADFISLNTVLKKFGYVCIVSKSSKFLNFHVSHKFDSSDLESKVPIRTLFSDIRIKKIKGEKIYEIRPSLGGDIWHAFSVWVRERAPQIIYYPNFLFDFPDKIYLDHNDNDSKLQRFYHHFIQDLLDSIDKGLSVENNILARAKKLDVHNKRALEGMIARLGSTMNSLMIDLNVFQFQLEDKKINLSMPQLELSTLRYYTQFTIQENEDTYDIKERSLGFRWFFTFVLFTQFRINRVRESPPVFLLDEPASNLHQTAQNRLLKAIGNLTKQFGSAVIYSTHSHHLINPMWLESTYIVKNKSYNILEDNSYDSRETDIQVFKYRDFLEKYPSDTDYFQPVLDALEYSPSQFEKIANAAILEGKNDYYMIHYFSKDVNLTYNLIPGTSATKLSVLISLYLGWGKKFIVLLDSDKAGESQKQRYIDDFGDLVKNKIFTLADIDGSWKNISLEKIFSNEEKVVIQQTKYPDDKKYNKSHFNLTIQEALINNLNLEMPLKVKESFSKILKFIESSINQE